MKLNYITYETYANEFPLLWGPAALLCERSEPIHYLIATHDQIVTKRTQNTTRCEKPWLLGNWRGALVGGWRCRRWRWLLGKCLTPPKAAFGARKYIGAAEYWRHFCWENIQRRRRWHWTQKIYSSCWIADVRMPETVWEQIMAVMGSCSIYLVFAYAAKIE